MTERELMIQGIARLFETTESQVEHCLGQCAFLNRPALGREADEQMLAAYATTDENLLRRRLEGLGLSVKRHGQLLESIPVR